MEQPLSCESAGDWLRGLLVQQDSQNEKEPDVRIATHSCKSTLLSMASKFGMPPTARRFLGYHSTGKDKSMLTYSRDSMSWPIRELEQMIEAILTDKFRPDETRSGFFPDGEEMVNIEDVKERESSSRWQWIVVPATCLQWLTAMATMLGPCLQVGSKSLISPKKN